MLGKDSKQDKLDNPLLNDEPSVVYIQQGGYLQKGTPTGQSNHSPVVHVSEGDDKQSFMVRWVAPIVGGLCCLLLFFLLFFLIPRAPQISYEVISSFLDSNSITVCAVIIGGFLPVPNKSLPDLPGPEPQLLFHHSY